MHRVFWFHPAYHYRHHFLSWRCDGAMSFRAFFIACRVVHRVMVDLIQKVVLMNSSSAATSRWAHMGRALRSRNYRLFFYGQGVSMIGTWMQRTALLWLVGMRFDDERTAALWLGVVGFCGQIPSLVLTPLAGALADRWNRHRMVVGAQVLAMIQAFVLAGMAFTNHLEMWHIIALSVWLGAVHAVDIPARQSFMLEMLDTPEDLPNAIALNSTLVNLGRLVGPALGGVVAAMMGASVCFLLNGLSFLSVIAALLFMRLPAATKKTVHRHILHNMLEGFQYAWRVVPIRSTLLLMSLVSLVAVPYVSLLPAMARHGLSCEAGGYGLLVAAAGMGALLGAVHLAGRRSAIGLERVMGVAPCVMGVALVVFAWNHSFWVALVLMGMVGMGQMLLIASGNTLLQTMVDDDKRGRVMSFYSLSFMGVMPLGNLLAGVAARHIGTSWTLTTGGILCVAGAVGFRAALPALAAALETKTSLSVESFPTQNIPYKAPETFASVPVQVTGHVSNPTSDHMSTPCSASEVEPES